MQDKTAIVANEATIEVETSVSRMVSAEKLTGQSSTEAIASVIAVGLSNLSADRNAYARNNNNQ